MSKTYSDEEPRRGRLLVEPVGATSVRLQDLLGGHRERSVTTTGRATEDRRRRQGIIPGNPNLVLCLPTVGRHLAIRSQPLESMSLKSEWLIGGKMAYLATTDGVVSPT